METQKTQNSQSNLEKEKWSWRNQYSWLQTIQQSCSHQDVMVLAQQPKYTSMEQDRKLRDTHAPMATLSLTKEANTYNGEKTASSISSAGKTGQLCMLLLLLSRFSHVRLRATPQTAARQAPPSLGFSRQEYWSRLPFPSPMHESEKWKKLLSCVWLLATPWTVAYQAPPSMGFSRQEYWSGVPLPSLGQLCIKE